MATSQNTHSVTNETLTEVLTRAQSIRLDNVAKRTGFTRKQMVRRAVDFFLEVEAPVYEAEARQGRRVQLI